MQIIEESGRLLIKQQPDFNVSQIFDCGQAFRFRKIDEGIYEGVAFGRYLQVEQTPEYISLYPCTLSDYENIWKSYFDLETDYTQIKKRISKKYEVLKEAVEFGHGIRILKQEPWEIIISFIISANNNIPRIQGAIEKLSALYGEPFTDPSGQIRYTFPSPQKLAEVSVEDLRACGVGYRDKYIKASAKMVAEGQVDIQKIGSLTIDEAEHELLALSGVGKKVADCILLFAFNHMSAFPVDTWVKKVIGKYFLKEDVTPKQALQFAESEFSKDAGYVQQYLFYYIREGKG